MCALDEYLKFIKFLSENVKFIKLFLKDSSYAVRSVEVNSSYEWEPPGYPKEI